MSTKRSLRIVSHEPGKSFADGAFAFEVPDDVDVTDQRLGYSYHTDPWWAEVGALLRERFDWPKAHLEPLRNLASPPESKVVGEVAPPIRAADWLNTPPIDLERLRGKVVLLVFLEARLNGGRQNIPALRRLHEIYQPAGLELIAVHAPLHGSEAAIYTPARSSEDIWNLLREFHVRFPVAIDAEGADPAGVTTTAYGAEGHPYAFLIDHEGKVHSVGEPTAGGGRLIGTLISLLERAGAQDVPKVSLDHSGLSDPMSEAVDAFFQEKAREALAANPSGRIAGRIVDGQGRPISGARVKADFHLTVLIFASPGGYQRISYDTPPERFSAATGPDGRFELPGLCKGAYELKIEAQGKARVERRLTVPPDLKPVTVEIALAQGGVIAGRVRDEQGIPIIGVVTPKERRHYERGHLRYTASAQLDPVTTDAKGSFRFEGVQEGRYTFEINAPGYEPAKLEDVSAGTEDATVTLKRPPAR